MQFVRQLPWLAEQRSTFGGADFCRLGTEWLSYQNVARLLAEDCATAVFRGAEAPGMAAQTPGPRLLE